MGKIRYLQYCCSYLEMLDDRGFSIFLINIICGLYFSINFVIDNFIVFFSSNIIAPCLITRNLG